MTLTLTPEITSHDFESNISIYSSNHKVLVYFDQQPQYQIESMNKILCATIYRDKIYMITQDEQELFILIYDSKLGIQLVQKPLEMDLPINFCQFAYHETLYLISQQKQSESIRLTKFIGEYFIKMKLKMCLNEGTPIMQTIEKDLYDFAFYKTQFLMLDIKNQILYRWDLPQFKDSFEDKIYYAYFGCDPVKVQLAQFMYLNNSNQYMLFVNNQECFDSKFELVETKIFFDVVKNDNQYILIQDKHKLIFNHKQLLLQYLNSKCVKWTQESLESQKKSREQSFEQLTNQYEQRLLEQNFNLQTQQFNIQIGYAMLKKDFIIDCDEYFDTVTDINNIHIIGFVFIHKDKLIVAVLDNTHQKIVVFIVTEGQKEKQKILLKEDISMLNIDTGNYQKVLFIFDQTMTEITDFSNLLIAIVYEKISICYQQQKEFFRVLGQLQSISLYQNQISYITNNVYGLINKQLPVYQFNLENRHPLATSMACQNCALFLTKSDLILVISENNNIYVYKENIAKYTASQVRFFDHHVELYGAVTFKLSDNISYLIEIYHQLLQSGEKIHITNAFAELRECDGFDGSCYLQLMTKRADKEQMLKLLFDKFNNNEKIIHYCIDYLYDRSFLMRYFQLLIISQPNQQFQMFRRVIQQIDRQSYSNIFQYLLTHQLFEQIDSGYVNYIMYHILHQSPPMFIILAKALMIKDSMIVQILDEYKQLLLKQLNEKTIFVYTRQCIQQGTTSLQNNQPQPIKIASLTDQDKFITLMQTIIYVYKLNPISGQPLAPKDESKNKFQKLSVDDDFLLSANQFYALKNQIFGSSIEKHFTVQDYRLQRFVPIYTQRQQIVEEVVEEKLNKDFVSKNAKVFVVNQQQDDQEDDQDEWGEKKAKKIKKFSIKSKSDAPKPQIVIASLVTQTISFVKSPIEFAQPKTNEQQVTQPTVIPQITEQEQSKQSVDQLEQQQDNQQQSNDQNENYTQNSIDASVIPEIGSVISDTEYQNLDMISVAQEKSVVQMDNTLNQQQERWNNEQWGGAQNQIELGQNNYQNDWQNDDWGYQQQTENLQEQQKNDW